MLSGEWFGPACWQRRRKQQTDAGQVDPGTGTTALILDWMNGQREEEAAYGRPGKEQVWRHKRLDPLTRGAQEQMDAWVCSYGEWSRAV